VLSRLAERLVVRELHAQARAELRAEQCARPTPRMVDARAHDIAGRALAVAPDPGTGVLLARAMERLHA
jgi:hypothetical protein